MLDRNGPARSGSRGSADLERLAWLLDSSIRLPGGFRIGIDGLIGLIPGIGDAIGALLSFYIISRASARGASQSVLARMVLNVALESIVGAIPVLGDAFDFAFKANQRNIALLQRYSVAPQQERRASWLVLTLTALGLVAAAIAILALAIALAQWIVASLR